ncbi:MAG: hemerythrin domain-containing protein [Candidatus Geothermincolia bacterium]
MKPIGPLMIEHRLIERLIALLAVELKAVDRGKEPDTILINAAIDFFRTYADRTHHGKEEDILFRELETRPLSDDHQRIMEELVDDHRRARGLVGRLEASRAAYLAGDIVADREIVEVLSALVALYPRHIETEDKRFFIPVMQYFDDEEQEAMLRSFYGFDREMIHEKYRGLVSSFE